MSDKLPEDLQYSKEHEWIRVGADGVARIGITKHAVDQLGEITMVTVPSVGDSLTAGDSFGDIDSVKTVSELYAPASGEIVTVNEALEDSPELVNESPYDGGWILEIRLETGSNADLMDASSYQAFLGELD